MDTPTPINDNPLVTIQGGIDNPYSKRPDTSTMIKSLIMGFLLALSLGFIAFVYMVQK